jgi:putative radical SAM enzyme (TIGR03279 family)
VVCPGINDDSSLTQTLRDLSSLKPEALSVAVVPVGLTQHRTHLPELNPVDASSAKQVIQQVEAFTQASQNQDFIFLSDEFYFKAGLPLPQYETYGDFPQLDDGVGTVRMLLEDFYALEESLPKTLTPPRNHLILTGQYAAMAITPIITRLNEIEGLYLDVVSVESQFWGMPVAVAGVITGQDILAALEKTELSGYQSAIIPAIMLKHDSETFLDGLTVSDLAQKLNLPFQVLQDPYSAEEFLAHLFEDMSKPESGSESGTTQTTANTSGKSERPISRQGRL